MTVVTLQPGVQVGDLVDLTVHFGNQTRFKCACCQRYLAVTAAGAECRSCGATYERVEDDCFRVVSLP